MKTAVSIPDPIFSNAERLAAQLKTSRSGLYARALDEFIGRHAGSALTDAMNDAVEAAGDDALTGTSPAVRRTMRATEW